MSKRFDVGALTPIDPDKLAARRRAPSTTLIDERRKSLELINRAASTQTIYVRPSECVIWAGNARSYSDLSFEACKELIDSIIAENGNRVPVTVRSIKDAAEGEPQFELLVGTRRHWAVAWANANNYPKIQLLAHLEEMSDEEAFRLADLENRARTDISDLERARNYKLAIDLYYGGVAARMAERLQISNAQLSKLLSLASLPTSIVAAFGKPSDLVVWHAEKLTPLLGDRSQRAAVEAEAKTISAEQSFRAAEDQQPIEAAQVVQRLLAAARPKGPGRRERPPLMAHSGAIIGKVLKDTARDGITVQITADDSVSEEDVLESLRHVIRSAKVRNKA